MQRTEAGAAVAECEGLLPRSTMRVPQPDIIEHFGNADAVPQPPERCLSRQAGIVRCCLWLLLYHTAGRLSTGQGETHIFCRFSLLYVHPIITFSRQIPILSNFTRLRLFHLSVMTIFVILYLSRRYSLEFQITVCYNFYTIVKGRSLTFFRYGIWALPIYFSRKGGYYQ